MAREARRENTHLEEILITQSRRFSFIQAIRLLRVMLSTDTDQEIEEDVIERRIRIRPELTLDFPACDIAATRKISDTPLSYEITATFLGLYGSSSPLPTFYTEDLLYERDDDKSITRDFIDILNTDLYAIFYRIWTKYRLFYNLSEEKHPKTLARLYSFTGHKPDTPDLDTSITDRLFRYAGLLFNFPRSAAGLRTFLSDWLGFDNVRIVQCLQRNAVVPPDQRLHLGTSGHALGHNAFVGLLVPDRMGKFQVQIGPVQHDLFLDLLPGRVAFNDIEKLINLYIDQPLDWELKVILSSDDIQCTQLGRAEWSHLGWNTWLFIDHIQEQEVSVTLNRNDSQ